MAGEWPYATPEVVRIGNFNVYFTVDSSSFKMYKKRPRNGLNEKVFQMDFLFGET